MSWTPRKFKISENGDSARLEMDVDLSPDEVSRLAELEIKDCPIVGRIPLLVRCWLEDNEIKSQKVS